MRDKRDRLYKGLKEGLKRLHEYQGLVMRKEERNECLKEEQKEGERVINKEAEEGWKRDLGIQESDGEKEDRIT